MKTLFCILFTNLFLLPTFSKVPSKVIAGYPSWSECDEKVVKAVENGVNVIIWFAINLMTNDTTGLPYITGGPDYDCVAKTVSQLNQNNFSVVNLISIGGWDAPHPDTRNNASAYFQAWVEWNKKKAKPEIGFNGFDGFDWDIEGNDVMSSANNIFTLKCLDLMGEMSQLAKKQGYVVSMAPAESYLDATTSEFNRSLLHNYPEWEKLQPNFTYHGRNCYSYLLAKYGHTIVHDQSMFTFDFISIQFYEGYSHIEYNTSVLNQSASDYLVGVIPKYIEGWTVNFEEDPETHLKNQKVRIPEENLIVGLANGWAGDGKFILIVPSELEKTYNELKRRDIKIRGFMFWDIADEGRVPNGWNKELWLAKELNKFMNTTKEKNENHPIELL